MKPKLKAPGIKRLMTLKYDKPLSRFAFTFNLRRYVRLMRRRHDMVDTLDATPEKLSSAVIVWTFNRYSHSNLSSATNAAANYKCKRMTAAGGSRPAKRI